MYPHWKLSEVASAGLAWGQAAHATANDERKPKPYTDEREVVESALIALTSPRHALRNAEAVVPHAPGLYAIYGTPPEWAELGLGKPADDRPLYVGKSESSLADRDAHRGARSRSFPGGTD